MFERFTAQGRQVVVFAQEEARSVALKHNYIGTEHLLLGLLCVEGGVAAQALGSLGVTADRVRSEVVRVRGRGNERASGQIPFTPRAQAALEATVLKTPHRTDRDIGTEHILLAIAPMQESAAARILSTLDVTPEQIRIAVARSVDRPAAGPAR
jgi:ATP-dependent Clp protease ATP-binding subunit ClpC